MSIALFLAAILLMAVTVACYACSMIAGGWDKDDRAVFQRRAIVAFALCLACAAGGAAYAEIPRAAHQHHRALVANARLVWGLDAPVATFAGQIHQESAWRADASSPYAGGLAQFTPATSDWIGGVFPELAERQPFNPSWAMRALVRYDRWLWERNTAASACDRMAFALVAYNGGEGWLRREQRAAREAGTAPDRWFAAVALYCLRGQAACVESRAYPAVILRRHQQLYAGWGPMTVCTT